MAPMQINKRKSRGTISSYSRKETSLTLHTSSVVSMGSIPGCERSPGIGNGNPLITLVWKIPWIEESGELQPMGWQRVRHD